jgi:TldD protein
MNVKPSPYLLSLRHDLKTIITELSSHFDYVSVLASDSKGKAYSVRTRSMDIRDFMGERGLVFRAVCQGRVAEVSLNDLKMDVPMDASQKVMDLLKSQFELQEKFESVLVDLSNEESTSLDVTKAYGTAFETKSPEEKLSILSEIVKEVGSRDPRIVNTVVQFCEVTVSKLFISTKKDMLQTYPWSQAYIVALGNGESGIKMCYNAVSGMKGLELLDELTGLIDTAVKNLDDTLKTTPIVPGEYEIICTPDITGLIAHEAFGHGVEMDMFVKNRAQAPQFINKAVASPLVGMHDGALVYDQVSSYAFDDEGTLAHDTVVIENGILEQGICDALSASRLNTLPTGNGKRENFERKAYTRMTSTYFTSGSDRLEDMIASIKKGYLLDGMESGMEDPKNWGIQCVLSRGYEIIDGKMTGKVVGPIILTGYVIDLLKSITMVSPEIELSGSGFCGKGHKEWVKTANGGAYIKATARLG